jgi:hypothetical protein
LNAEKTIQRLYTPPSWEIARTPTPDSPPIPATSGPCTSPRRISPLRQASPSPSVSSTQSLDTQGSVSCTPLRHTSALPAFFPLSLEGHTPGAETAPPQTILLTPPDTPENLRKRPFDSVLGEVDHIESPTALGKWLQAMSEPPIERCASLMDVLDLEDLNTEYAHFLKMSPEVSENEREKNVKSYTGRLLCVGKLFPMTGPSDPDYADRRSEMLRLLFSYSLTYVPLKVAALTVETSPPSPMMFPVHSSVIWRSSSPNLRTQCPSTWGSASWPCKSSRNPL